MEEVYQLVQARNAHETIPFQSVYNAYEVLQRNVDSLQLRCDVLEYERRNKEWESVDKAQVRLNLLISFSDIYVDPYVYYVLLIQKDGRLSSQKNESNLKDKVDRLQQELDEKLSRFMYYDA